MAKQRKHGGHAYRLESIRSRGDWVVVTFSWTSGDGRRQTWAQALRLTHGKIIDIQDYAHPMSATAMMRLRATFG